MTSPLDPIFVTRRGLLRLGALGIGGLSLSCALELMDSIPLRGAKARSAVLFWLNGGASHIDTFDPKPGAPEEIRGDWKSVPTPVPGVEFGEGMEGLAAALPNYALLRSVTSDFGEHEIARHFMLTGYPISPAQEYPSYGSVV